MAYEYKYNPNRGHDWNYGGKKWRLSRSKIDLFIECPRCFYLDNKLGTKRPGFPAFTLNIAVDELLKKEFDVHRKSKSKHPIMEKYDIDAVPFVHKELNKWRENFEGIECIHKPTNLTVSGAIDDVWVKPDGTLIVVDYKATAKEGKIEALGDSPWEIQYTRQLGVYKWLLENNGFTVNDVGYLVYANADKNVDTFSAKLVFDVTLVPVKADTEWIAGTLGKILECLESEMYPNSGATCEFCPYREASGKKLLTIHSKKIK